MILLPVLNNVLNTINLKNNILSYYSEALMHVSAN